MDHNHFKPHSKYKLKMEIKVWHFQFKFKCDSVFNVQFVSVSNNSVQFKLFPDTPTTLAASHHAQKIPSLTQWRRRVEGLGLARHLESRLCVCTPAHRRPILSLRAELQTKQKNLTCVTGHKHNKSPFKMIKNINKWSSCNITATVFFHHKMAAERSLWTCGSVPHNN